MRMKLFGRAAGLGGFLLLARGLQQHPADTAAGADAARPGRPEA